MLENLLTRYVQLPLHILVVPWYGTSLLSGDYNSMSRMLGMSDGHSYRCSDGLHPLGALIKLWNVESWIIW